MPKLIRNYKRHLLNNLIYDDFFLDAENVYIDLVIMKDLKAMLIPNKVNIGKPMTDMDLKGFEAVIIPTGINLLEEDKLSYDVLLEKLPSEENIKDLLDENKGLIEEFKNTRLK